MMEISFIKSLLIYFGQEWPNIIIEAAKLTKENKNELIRTLTRSASEITKIPETSCTVLIKEFPVENWGIGGEPLEELIKRKMNS